MNNRITNRELDAFLEDLAKLTKDYNIEIRTTYCGDIALVRKKIKLSDKVDYRVDDYDEDDDFVYGLELYVNEVAA